MTLGDMGGNQRASSFLVRHRPSILVLTSQISAGIIHGIVKVLETQERSIHPFNILQFRLFITGISSTLFLWYKGHPHFPLGPREVRPLLILRAVGGVCAAIGFYCMAAVKNAWGMGCCNSRKC